MSTKYKGEAMLPPHIFKPVVRAKVVELEQPTPPGPAPDETKEPESPEGAE